VLSPSTPLGDKIQTFLLYHEIGHALSTSVTHHWYEGIAPIRELSRYLPASLLVHGWTATSLIGLLYLADCFTSMYDFDGPEIDADYIAARALLSQYGEKIANESIELACYALRRRAEVETNNKRKLQRREKILRRVWSRVPKSISADSWAYGPIFRLISLVRLVTMFAAFAVVFAYCKPVSEVGTLIVLAMLMGAAIQGMTMNWRLRTEVAKLQDFLRQVIDRPLSDQDSYDKLIAAFSPEAVAGLIMKPWFATTHFITK
jgi:hypothetical protein